MESLAVIGIGGGGGMMAVVLQKEVGGRGIVINTDVKALDSHSFSEKLAVAAPTCDAIEAMTPEVQAAFFGLKTIVLAVGLGGKTGSSITPAISRIAKDMGIEVFAAVTLPFEYEVTRKERAEKSLQDLRDSAATVLIHDHATQSFAAGLDTRSMTEILDASAQSLARGIMNSLHQTSTAES